MKPEKTNANVQVRLAIPDEVSDIAAVLYQSFVEYRSLYTPQGFAATTPVAEVIRTRFPEGPIWVAVQNNSIVGTVSAVPKGEDVYIRSMAVLPTTRGLGVGRLLLQRVEEFASMQGAWRMYLSTTPFLERAIQLYEHFGFQRTPEGPHDLFGTPLFTMTKVLLPEADRC